MLLGQNLSKALTKVAPRHLRTHVLVVLDDILRTLRTLLSDRVSNVALSGGCRFRPKYWALRNQAVGLPHGGVVDFNDVTSRLAAEALTHFSVLVNDAAVAHFSFVCLQC